MDLSAVSDTLGQFKPTSQSLLIFAIILIGSAYLYFTPDGRKLREHLGETIFANWRLGLLGATGLVLSLASGWTTWDGMRNFTKEPVLSLMITFGIQGVMLIVAWLIGESFATGMNYKPSSSSQRGRSFNFVEPAIGTIIGVFLFAAIVLLILKQTWADEYVATDGTWTGAGGYLLPTGLLIAVVAILFLLALIMNSGRDIAGNYLQAMRIIIRSAVLWVMFLACMATSVFFSFDSLFSTIFPKQERARAAELRAQNQVAGVITDIATITARRQLEEQDRLFLTEDWKVYDLTLEKLVGVAREAPKALQDYFEDKVRSQQSLVAQRQQEKASAESQQVRLKQRTAILNTTISRAREAVTQLSPVVNELKGDIFSKDREIVVKKAEAEAEAGGIGVTARSGRGPKYREIVAQMRILQEQKKNLQLQLSEYEKRLTKSRKDIAQAEAELSTAQGELATLKGRAQTADQLIQLAEMPASQNESEFDPTSGLRQLERARVAFRQTPEQEALSRIQGLCNSLVGAMSQVPALKPKAVQFDCDPGQANEAASRVFALNAGLKALKATCIGGDKLPKSGGADGLFLFARKCVQDAGLPSSDTNELRTRINYLELNRDDRAHRFVVTTNAFSDGNKLAYLALAIAIAIDSLVFMSGLFGANAVRSPLTDVPSYKGRSAQQLEAIIDTALQPHAYETARLVLGSLRPITPIDGFTGEIVVDDADPHANDLRRVLNAGSSIGAVRHADERERFYQVRAEFFEYLSIAAHREFEKDKNRVEVAELERTVSVSLLPDITTNADIVLDYMHPIKEDRGFMAEIILSEIQKPAHLRVVRGALNAGAVYERVQRKETSNHYWIHSDFYKILSALRARQLMSRKLSSGGKLGSHQLGQVRDGANMKVGAMPPPITARSADQLMDETRSFPTIEDTARAYLINALGITRELYEDTLVQQSSAVAAQGMIERVVNITHPRISERLQRFMSKNNGRIDAAGDEMKARFGKAETAEIIINDVTNEFRELLPVLVFRVDGPYREIIRENIRQLEQATRQDELELGDEEVLSQLRRHEVQLANARSVDAVLSAIAGYLGEQTDLPKVVRMGSTRKI